MDYPNYDLENQAKELGYKYIVGVDEVGRGAGAASVVAAAVYVPPESINLLSGKVNDSKKLSVKKREELFTIINDNCLVGIGNVSAETIDDINILEATKLAMKQAIEDVAYYDYILVDGTVDLSKHIKYCPYQRIIKGDAKSISIAAASIIAKVTRDRIMIDLDKEWPIYGWKKNKGYLTKEHIEAINTYGITDYHRTTFKKVGR